MANDPPPSPPPPRRRFFFPFRIEQKGVLEEPVPEELRMLVRDRSGDNEGLFIQCMPDAARRRIAFNVVERNCCEAFARGKAGVALFLKVRDLVKRAEVQE